MTSYVNAILSLFFITLFNKTHQIASTTILRVTRKVCHKKGNNALNTHSRYLTPHIHVSSSVATQVVCINIFMFNMSCQATSRVSEIPLSKDCRLAADSLKTVGLQPTV